MIIFLLIYLHLVSDNKAYKGHCVLSKNVLSFVFQIFDFQVLCFWLLCFVSCVVKWRDGDIKGSDKMAM